MKYSDEKAAEVKAKFPDIDDITLKIWRLRDAIPDRYFKEGFVFRKKVREITPVEGLKQDWLQQVFNNDKLYRERLGQLAGLDKTMVMEFLKGRVKLTEAERLRLTTVIQQLRNDIKNKVGDQNETMSYVRQRAIFGIATDDRLKKTPLFGEFLGRKLSKSAINRDGVTFDKLDRSQYQQIVDAFYLLLLETTL